jgi:hypothetical protein
MDKVIKFRATGKEKAIIAVVAQSLGGGVSQAIRYMIREHARCNMTLREMEQVVALEAAQQ